MTDLLRLEEWRVRYRADWYVDLYTSPKTPGTICKLTVSLFHTLQIDTYWCLHPAKVHHLLSVWSNRPPPPPPPPPRFHCFTFSVHLLWVDEAFCYSCFLFCFRPWPMKLDSTSWVLRALSCLTRFVVVAFSSLVRILGECSTIHSPTALFFFFFLNRRLARAR